MWREYRTSHFLWHGVCGNHLRSLFREHDYKSVLSRALYPNADAAAIGLAVAAVREARASRKQSLRLFFADPVEPTLAFRDADSAVLSIRSERSCGDARSATEPVHLPRCAVLTPMQPQVCDNMGPVAQRRVPDISLFGGKLGKYRDRPSFNELKSLCVRTH